MNKFLKITILILIIMGVIYNITFIFSFDKKYQENIQLEAIVKIVSEKKEKENSNSYTVKILKSNISKTKNTKIILYTSKSENLKYGDIIKISGKFSKPDCARNYKGFDYRNYLKQSKIYGSIYCKNVEFLNHESSLFEKIFILKEKMIDTLNNLYDENSSAFLRGILLGDNSNLDDEIKENFRNSSMSHVLAISGMHIAYVILGIQFILNKMINSQKLKNYLLILILVFFAVITGASSSCVRACIMSAMLLISQNFYRKNNFYVTIFITFLILIFINPYNIYAVGMWLSFGGTLGIVLFQNFLKRFLQCKFKLKSKFLKAVLDIILVSLSAQILILPIMIYCFNTVSLTFFISNLLIYFLVGPILALGYISLFLGIVIFPLGKLISIFENFLIFLIFKIAEICSKIPFSKILVVTPNFGTVILYYILLSGIIFLFHKKKIKFLRFILGDGFKKFYKKYNYKIISSFLIFILLINSIKVFPQNLKIYFVDVGQGDCAVIQTPGRKNIIIDGGNNQKYDYGKNVVVPYLLDRKIKTIDYLMISHFDSDHCGGLFEVLENLKVKNIIIGKQENSYNNYVKFIETAKKKKIKINVVEKGNIIKIDKKTRFEILWPDSNNMFDDANNGINNNSMTAKLICKDFSMLFTGDIEAIAEEEILKVYQNSNILDVDILKVAHHGSKSSSVEEIIKNINPKVALIGVGKDNKYGHPSKDVLERFNKIGCRFFRTDLNGEIAIKVKKKLKFKINTMIK